MQTDGMPTTSRRRALGEIAGALALGHAAMPASASQAGTKSDPDAELLRLGAECLLSLRDWGAVEDEELSKVVEERYLSTLERFLDMDAQTPAGLAMQLRVQFVQQCNNQWTVYAALAMELTDQQIAEIDGLDMQIFRHAQTAMRIAAAGRA